MDQRSLFGLSEHLERLGKSDDALETDRGDSGLRARLERVE